MRLILRLIDGLCAAGAALAAFACASLAVMLIIEVITTSFMSWSQPWAVEYSGYLLCASLFAGSGWTLRQGGHIRVTVLTQALPPRGQWLMDLLATAFALGLTLYATLAVGEYAMRSFALGSVSFYPSQTPLFYPQLVLALSFGLLMLSLVARLLRLLTGQATEAERPGGSVM